MKDLFSPSWLRSFTFLAAGLISLAPAFAQETEWNGGNSGSWGAQENWTNDLPTLTGTALFRDLPAASPIEITVTEGAKGRILTFSNTGNRSYTFSGERLTLTGTGTSGPRFQTTNTSGIAAITFNNDLYFTHETSSSNATFTIGGSVANGSRFSTLTINGQILTDAPGEEVGNRTLALNPHADATIILNGRNEASQLTFSGAGEVVVGHVNAFGERAAVQKTSSSVLSLRSDLTITGISNIYSWSHGTYTTSLRISESATSSNNRTLTFAKRILAGDGGGFLWLDNINSTGKLILDLKYDGTSTLGHAGHLTTNSSAVVRFSQENNVFYSGVMSGDGQLENASGGTTTLHGLNTYTGDTHVETGTLLLSETGGLTFAIGESGLNNQITGTSLGSIALNGTFTFDLTEASTQQGDHWMIIDFGNLGSVSFGDTFSVADFKLDADDGIWSHGDYRFSQATGMLTVIPEPSSLAFAGLVGLGLLLNRRKLF